MDMVNARYVSVRRRFKHFATIAVLAAIGFAATTGDAADNVSVYATRHMVSAANPFAARAGLEILRRGGSAVDAAIARPPPRTVQGASRNELRTAVSPPDT